MQVHYLIVKCGVDCETSGQYHKYRVKKGLVYLAIYMKFYISIWPATHAN